MSLLINEPIMIDQEHPNIGLIKMIIKEQGVNVCRDEIDQSYIVECLKTFDYGYVILGNRNVSEKSKKYVLKGYVLFRYEERGSIVMGKILCGHRGVGRLLLESVLQFITEREVQTWIIYSLPFEKLINYYQEFGFKIINIIYRGGKKKCYEMRKDFTYDHGPRKPCLLEECPINV